MTKKGGYRSPTQTRKGVPNKTNAATRERIEKEADPVGFLINIMNGQPMPIYDKDGKEAGHQMPTAEHRVSAAKDLMKKIAPDLKAVEHSGDMSGGPVVFQVVSAINPPNSSPKKAKADE